MTILERVEHSLESFRPRNRKEFVVLQIAQRFNDESNLARYLNVCQQHPKNVLLEAARLAAKQHETSGEALPNIFFELLTQFREEVIT
jgi:hypothetical protein